MPKILSKSIQMISALMATLTTATLIKNIIKNNIKISDIILLTILTIVFLSYLI